ncbi:recombinase family protein [Clostridium amazonitimonense]|uniref:recombinase family protein n=1 Tax=Clostridium amazonitimonense TaxID=1499689 RepID=UPI003D6E61C1
MYRMENNHESIISKEMFDLVQQESKKRFEISSGKMTIEENTLISMTLVESWC